MRKLVGVLFAVAMVLPVGLVASSAGALSGAGAVCTISKGTAKFSPALPILGSKTKVAATLTATVSLTGCVGSGGVTSGRVGLTPGKVLVGKPSKVNCSALFTTVTKGTTPVLMTGTETVTWNTKATSTVSVHISPMRAPVPPGTTRYTVQVLGTVTAGLFKGQPTYGTFAFDDIGGACSKNPMGGTTVNSSHSNSY